MTPTIPPLVRILRTLFQLLVAFPLLVPALVAALHQVGVESISEAGLLAIAATALALVVAVQNFLEKAQLIPTLGANTAGAARAENAIVAHTLDRVASGEIPAEVIGGAALAGRHQGAEPEG